MSNNSLPSEAPRAWISLRQVSLHRVSLHHGALLLGTLSLLALQMQNFADDPGVGWHLATGQWISKFGRVPETDPFLAVPRAWISDQWLSDVLLHQLYSLGSWPLIYAMFTVLYLGSYFGFLYRYLTRAGASALGATLGVLVAFKAGQIHFILRPVEFSFLFFVLVYGFCLVEEARWRRAECALSKSAFICLPLLFCLWANIHPAFVLGLFALTVFSCLSIFPPSHCSGLQLRRSAALFSLTALCLAATFVNPYGIQLHRSILFLQQSKYFMQLHEEWRPIQFATPEGELFAASVVLVLAGAVVGRGALRAGSLFSLLMSLFFAAAALGAVRMVPFFGISVSYCCASAVQAIGRNPIFDDSPLFGRLREAFRFFEGRELRASPVWWVLAPLAAGLLASSVTRGDLLLYRGPFGPTERRYPYAAVRELLHREELKAQKPIVVAAGPEWGGFITLMGAGRLKALIDDRNTLNGEEYSKRYEDRLENARDWREFLDEMGAQAILLQPSRRLIAELETAASTGWRIVYRDSSGVLALRAESQLQQ